jgi:ABC-2 type transport system ATP-binding protein
VSLASVLAGGADLVFLDEPTLGLDVESSRTLRRELRRLAREEGLTIVLSSHDMAVIEAVCDRVVMLADGRIVADDTVAALLSAADRDVLGVASPDIDAALIDTLRTRFEVTAVERGETTRVDIVAPGDTLYAVMETLRTADVTIESLRTRQPALEDVFVDRTGMAPDGDDQRRRSL